MNAHTNITPHDATELAALEAVHETLGQLIAIRRTPGVGPANPNRLWAEFDFTKALHLWAASDQTEEWFLEACRNLNVDPDGERRAA